MSSWQEAYRDLDPLGGEIRFLLEDHEDMIEIRYADGMVIDLSYIEHWHSYSITVLSDDTRAAWQNPIEEVTVDEKADLPRMLGEMIRKHRSR